MNYFVLKMHKFHCDNFNKNLTKYSCFNYHTKTHVSNLLHFQGEMVHFFLPKRGAEKQSVNIKKFDHYMCYMNNIMFLLY